VLRIAGKLENLRTGELTPRNVEELVSTLLSPEQWELLEAQRELDFAISVPGVSRFRGNAHFQRSTLAASFRTLPLTIPLLEELGVPVEVLTRMATRSSGLVLVTGPTGSGKTTTLASLLDLINSQRESHIITIEDPIEYLHNHKKALVKQRELHTDTLSFGRALKHILRQDPNVILVGEMRDLETFSATITAAETGHLVFSSLHTKDSIQTIDRIIDAFPPHQQSQIRIQLAGALEGIVCQRLLPHANEQKLILACEVLVATDAVRSMIREEKTHMLSSTIESSTKQGMVTMDRSLLNLYDRHLITRETLMRNCIKPDYVLDMLGSREHSLPG
jgi:twitching motility protein PilT